MGTHSYLEVKCQCLVNVNLQIKRSWKLVRRRYAGPPTKSLGSYPAILLAFVMSFSSIYLSIFLSVQYPFFCVILSSPLFVTLSLHLLCAELHFSYRYLRKYFRDLNFDYNLYILCMQKFHLNADKINDWLSSWPCISYRDLLSSFLLLHRRQHSLNAISHRINWCSTACSIGAICLPSYPFLLQARSVLFISIPLSAAAKISPGSLSHIYLFSLLVLLSV